MNRKLNWRCIPIAKIALTGMMGSGKTTAGQLLAAKLELPFLDMDREIERRAGMEIKKIFASFGEAEFRRRETAFLAELHNFKGIIATGGGVVMNPDNIGLLRQGGGVIVYLFVPFLDLERRLKGDETRPLLADDPAALADIYRRREKVYRREADLIVEGTGSPEQVALTIAARLKEF